MIYPPQEQRRLSSKHSFSCSPPVCLDTSGRKPRSGFVPVRVHLSLDWVMNIKAEICAAWTEENVPERTENWWGERGAGGVMDGWVVSWKQTFMLLLLIHEKWVTLVCTSCIRYPHMASLCMMFFPFSLHEGTTNSFYEKSKGKKISAQGNRLWRSELSEQTGPGSKVPVSV